MTALEALEFGPFTTAYHQRLVTDTFKDSVRHFIAENLIPQVDHDIVEIDGSFLPRATEDRNCGPHSAVRNCFFLEIRFFGHANSDYSLIKTQLWYRPTTERFQVATGSSLYVWTPRRRRERELEKESIQILVDSILKHEATAPCCPICGSSLSVVNTAYDFNAVCPGRCFRYNFHKDEQGHLTHGHFIMREPAHDA